MYVFEDLFGLGGGCGVLVAEIVPSESSARIGLVTGRTKLREMKVAVGGVDVMGVDERADVAGVEGL